MNHWHFTLFCIYKLLAVSRNYMSVSQPHVGEVNLLCLSCLLVLIVRVMCLHNLCKIMTEQSLYRLD